MRVYLYMIRCITLQLELFTDSNYIDYIENRKSGYALASSMLIYNFLTF